MRQIGQTASLSALFAVPALRYREVALDQDAADRAVLRIDRTEHAQDRRPRKPMPGSAETFPEFAIQPPHRPFPLVRHTRTACPVFAMPQVKGRSLSRALRGRRWIREPEVSRVNADRSRMVPIPMHQDPAAKVRICIALCAGERSGRPVEEPARYPFFAGRQPTVTPSGIKKSGLKNIGRLASCGTADTGESRTYQSCRPLGHSLSAGIMMVSQCHRWGRLPSIPVVRRHGTRIRYCRDARCARPAA
mgnify:FL=1